MATDSRCPALTSAGADEAGSSTAGDEVAPGEEASTATRPSVTSSSTAAVPTWTEKAVPTARKSNPAAFTTKGRAGLEATSK